MLCVFCVVVTCDADPRSHDPTIHIGQIETLDLLRSLLVLYQTPPLWVRRPNCRIRNISAEIAEKKPSAKDREEAARTRVLLADFALGRFGCAV